jgi:two-component system sensor histidine kinase YesM
MRITDNKKLSLRSRLGILAAVAALPFLGVSVYLLISLKGYSDSYDSIVSNLMIANHYNLDFKDDLDESIYRLVAGSVTDGDVEEEDTAEDPYVLVDQLRTDFRALEAVTTEEESRLWLQSLLRNLDTLEDRIDDIWANLDEGGHYDENMQMLDNNIYILTELIQDDIAHYIYYQTSSMDVLRQQLDARVEEFTIVLALLLLALVLLLLQICALSIGGIVRPIEVLRRLANEISHGNFRTRVTVQGPAEIAELSGAINDMTVHLEDRENKIKDDERKMRQAELRLLQEQINPHFLYNTLDTIVWLIEDDAADDAVEMVVALSRFFRLVLSGGAENISIREEEQHIRSYLMIQQVRYRDILDYEIAIDPALYPYQIQKLTLQPLVENALYHGIKYKRARGRITIRGWMEGRRIFLTVEDDGVGMEQETLARLRRDIERPCRDTEGGFGLANVNERIRIYFGDYYGMQIDSTPGAGTRVMVMLPARPCSAGNARREMAQKHE